MQGLKVLVCAAVVGLCASQAFAQGYYIPSGPVGFPVVAGPVYTPVPTVVRYAPAYRYVTPVVATEVVPAPVVAAPVTGYVTQTSYYAPTVITPVVPVVRPYARVSVFPRRGVVRVRF